MLLLFLSSFQLAQQVITVEVAIIREMKLNDYIQPHIMPKL